MRIDMYRGGKRPWFMGVFLQIMKWRIGMVPGPPLAITYRPDLFHKTFVGYIMRAMHGSGGWDKGHAEMFGAFVSHLNTCHF